MTKTTLSALASAVILTLATSGAAFAETAVDKATAHFNAIASADVDAAMAGYAEDAVFQWVGGPLDGVYSGADAIRGAWTKFTGAQGEIGVDVADVQTAANPKGTTVSANVVFHGKKAIPVRYVLVYRDGALVSEIWQIAAMKTGY